MDKEDRLLLFKFGSRRRNHVWLTPGGGIDEGEAVNAAAARELREETGLVVTPEQLGDVVAMTGGYAELGSWIKGNIREDFFFHRVDPPISTTAVSPTTSASPSPSIRWWSVADLEAAADHVVPWGLAPLLSPRSCGTGCRKIFVELPWHH